MTLCCRGIGSSVHPPTPVSLGLRWPGVGPIWFTVYASCKVCGYLLQTKRSVFTYCQLSHWHCYSLLVTLPVNLKLILNWCQLMLHWCSDTVNENVLWMLWIVVKFWKKLAFKVKTWKVGLTDSSSGGQQPPIGSLSVWDSEYQTLGACWSQQTPVLLGSDYSDCQIW